MIHPDQRDRPARDERSLFHIIALAVVMFLFFPCSDARAQLRRFTPTVSNYFGNVEFNATYETYKSTFRGRGTETTDLSFSEKVTLGIGGYVYHPRLLIFNVSVGAGALEEYYESETVSKWNYASVEEYEAKMYLLPRHKYSAELYSRRRNPIIKGRLSPGLSPVIYEHGANLSYKTRPLSLYLNYSLENISSGGESTDTQAVRLGGNHLWGPFRTNINLNHSDSDSTIGLASTTDSLFFENMFDYKKVSLRSQGSYQEFDQTSPGVSFNDKILDWDERLIFEISESLTASGNYVYTKTERESEGESTTSESRTIGGGLVHRFYQSIISGYNIAYSESESLRSRSETMSQTVRVNYRKRIPWGRLMTGFSGRLTHTSRMGPLRILNEKHEASLFPPEDRFALSETDVETRTILIRIVEPGTGFLFLLDQGIHYEIETIGNQTFITIFSVSDISPFISGDGPFSFQVDYTTALGDSEYETKMYSYSIKLDLFDRRLVPYYQYTRTTQELIEGQLPGGPEDATSHAFGVSTHGKQYSLSVDYQILESRLNPQKRLNVTGTYRKAFSEHAKIDVKAIYRKTDYEKGENELASAVAYSEDLYSLFSRVNLYYPKKNLNVFFGNTLFYRKSIADSYGITFNSGLVWRIGLLRLNAGFNWSYTLSELRDSDLVRDHRYLYFRAVRELF